jgi:tRNA (guanine37-N1)-methyltransferase
MEIDIMTLFPEAVEAMLGVSILGRARERGFIAIRAHQIRAYTTNKQMQVDDYPYGGGRGAVMQADPLYRCWAHIVETYGPGRTIFLSPCGRTFTQDAARELKERYAHLILVCGHYEGVDERFLEECADEEISIGDYVLTGGEIPAMAVTDAVCRMVPGVLPDPECFQEESHWDGLLEYPQYSRPAVWHGRAVPEVLLSGHHAKVDEWRRKESYKRTMTRRPDMFARFDESKLTTKAEKRVLQEAREELRALPESVPAPAAPVADGSSTQELE